MSEKKYRLLIADDEERILRGMERYVKGHSDVFGEIDCALNGNDALDLIFRYHPDVMLVDVQMPGKTGLEVMKEAAKAGYCPKTVILSGYDTFSYVQQALRMGASDYLLKPCRSTEILEKLESLVPNKTPVEAVEDKEPISTVKPHRPERPSSEKLSGTRSPILQEAIAYCKEHLGEELSLSQVAEHVHVTPAYLSMLFSANMGGFVEFLNRTRIEYACAYMHDETLRIYEIAFKTGFRDEKYFSRVFKKITGMSPSVYRENLYKEN